MTEQFKKGYDDVLEEIIRLLKEAQDILRNDYKMDIIEHREVPKTIMKETERTIIAEHEKKHSIKLHKDGRWRTRLPDGSNKGRGRTVAKVKREDLEQEVINFYCPSQKKQIKQTIRNMYPVFIERKQLERLKDSSIARYRNTWNKYLENDKVLVDMELKDLTTSIYKEWALRLLNAKPMKSKAYKDLTLVLFGIIDLAVEKDYIPRNVCRNAILSKNVFLPDDRKADKQVFTSDEEKRLESYLWEQYNANTANTIPLAILFQFQTGLRVGELAAIRFSDLDEEGFMLIQREKGVVDNESKEGKLKETVVEWTKTTSRRTPIYVTENARHIMELARQSNEQNGDTELGYVFCRNHAVMTRAQINQHLTRACKKLGIDARRSHAVRKTVGTKMHDAGISDAVIMSQMGHADISTTRRFYVKDRYTRSEKSIALEQVFGGKRSTV